MANEIKHYSFGTVASPIAPAAGTYTLTFDGETTSAIQWNDDSTTIQAALEALSSIGSGNVSVADDGNNGFTVEFIGGLADRDITAAFTATSSLKQAASTVTVTETQAGESGVSQQIFTVSLDDAPTEGAFILNEMSAGDTAAIDEDAAASTVEAAIDALVAYTVTGSAGGTWTCTSVAQEAYFWSGFEDPTDPLLKALAIEVETTQEGDGFFATGSATQGAASSAGAGYFGFTGSGSATQAAATASGEGTRAEEATEEPARTFAGMRGMCAGACCPEGGCVIFADDFDRADGTDLGPDWTEAAGAWAISSNTLLTSTNNSIAIADTPHPTPLTTAVVSVSVTAGSGTTVRVIGNYLDDNNYHYVQAALSTSGISVSLVKRSAGSNTTLLTYNDSADDWTAVAIKLCISKVGIATEISGPRTIVKGAATTRIVGGYQAGVSVGTVVTSAAFGGFSFTRHASGANPDCPICPTVCGTCCDPSIPPFSRYRIDLGAGGWVDDLCSYCDQALGEVIVEATSDCSWKYQENDVCDLGCNPGLCILPVYFRVTLALVNDGTGCLWQSEVKIGFTAKDPACPCEEANAVYRSGYLADEEKCRTLPVTLSKVSEFVGTVAGTRACSGSLPTTITLEAA